MKKPLLYIFVLLFSLPLIRAQERPAIDENTLIASSETDSKELMKTLEDANRFYKKGVYDEAFKLYYSLYEVVDTLNALNYRLGVSALMATYPEPSTTYLSQSNPSIAKDYYYRLGQAYQLNHQYEAAYEAYDKYNQSLNKWHKKRFSSRFQQLVKECRFGAIAIKDSLAYFVANLGESVNSHYDEYSPVILSDSAVLYFTSRQPQKPIEKPINRSLMSENIKFTTFSKDGSTISQFLEGIDQSGNVSVAGADHLNKRLFIYKGAKRSGSIFSAQVQSGMVSKKDRMKGAINSKTIHETYLSISSLGDAAFVSNKRKYKSGYDIYFSKSATESRIKKSVAAKVLINTPFDERSVTFSPDGTTLYFSSNGHEGMGGYDIYKAHRLSDGSWSEPVNLGYPINTAADELYYYPTSDSLVALVASNRSGGFGGLDIYQVVKDLRVPFDLWGEITDQESGKTVSARISIINADTKSSIISVANDSLSGEYFVPFDDVGNYWIQVEADNYLSEIASFDLPSERHARVRKDFQLERLTTPFTIFGKVLNKSNGAPVQAEILFSQLGNDSIIARDYTNGTDGSYSIILGDKLNLIMQVNAMNFYSLTDTLILRDYETDSFKKDLLLDRSKISYTVMGIIKDAKDNSVIPASLSFYEPGAVTPFLQANSDSLTGKYSVTTEEEGPFLVEVNADGYFFMNIPLVFHEDSTLLTRNILLQKMSMGSKIVVENILFNTGKATLLPQSFIELNKLARLLNDNKDIRIEVSGHSDNVGSANLNKRLSKSRAESVRNYLREHGVEASRMEFEGYGFDRPIESNDTAEGRAANRRVEIEVIE